MEKPRYPEYIETPSKSKRKSQRGGGCGCANAVQSGGGSSKVEVNEEDEDAVAEEFFALSMEIERLISSYAEQTRHDE
jgi:hypothetical protein